MGCESRAASQSSHGGPRVTRQPEHADAPRLPEVEAEHQLRGDCHHRCQAGLGTQATRGERRGARGGCRRRPGHFLQQRAAPPGSGSKLRSRAGRGKPRACHFCSIIRPPLEARGSRVGAGRRSPAPRGRSGWGGGRPGARRAPLRLSAGAEAAARPAEVGFPGTGSSCGGPARAARQPALAASPGRRY